MQQHIAKIGDQTLFQMASLGSAFITGFHQRGKVFLTNTAVIKLVEGSGKFFEIFIALGDGQFFQPGDKMEAKIATAEPRKAYNTSCSKLLTLLETCSGVLGSKWLRPIIRP
jgi:hypothetical protein